MRGVLATCASTSIRRAGYAIGSIMDLGGTIMLRKSTKKCSYSVVMAVLVVLTLVVVCIALALEITKLKSEITPMDVSPLQLTLSAVSNRLDNITEHYKLVSLGLQQTLVTLSEQLDNVTETFSKIQQLFTSNNNMHQRFSRDISALNLVFERYFQAFPASSCADIPLTSPLGYYWVRSLNGSAVRVFCDMTRSCGGVTGGWMRVAELDIVTSVPVVSCSTPTLTYAHV